MKRVLVTGAAGFIGSHLCESLLARGDRVVGVDCFTEYYDPARKHANLAAGLSIGLDFRRHDLVTDPLGELLAGVDAVFHLAGQPGVRDSWGEEFGLYAARNVVATQRLLEASARAGVRRFILASSSSVYGGGGAERVSEETLRSPISPYGLTKASCEDLVDVYRRTSGLSAVSLRYFTVYGPRQRPEMAFARFIRRVLAGEPLEIFGDGSQMRDFTYVADVVAGTIAAAERGTAPVYNLSGGSSVRLLDAVAEIERIAGRRAIIDFRDAARGDVRCVEADLMAARRDLAYRPSVTLAEGLERQVASELESKLEAEVAA